MKNSPFSGSLQGPAVRAFVFIKVLLRLHNLVDKYGESATFVGSSFTSGSLSYPGNFSSQKGTIMNSQTLGQFLLSRYQGATLASRGQASIKPDTVSAMPNYLDSLFTEHWRFKFKFEKLSLEEVRSVLVEYYESIGWGG